MKWLCRRDMWGAPSHCEWFMGVARSCISLHTQRWKRCFVTILTTFYVNQGSASTPAGAATKCWPWIQSSRADASIACFRCQDCSLQHRISLPNPVDVSSPNRSFPRHRAEFSSVFRAGHHRYSMTLLGEWKLCSPHLGPWEGGAAARIQRARSRPSRICTVEEDHVLWIWCQRHCICPGVRALAASVRKMRWPWRMLSGIVESFGKEIIELPATLLPQINHLVCLHLTRRETTKTPDSAYISI